MIFFVPKDSIFYTPISAATRRGCALSCQNNVGSFPFTSPTIVRKFTHSRYAAVVVVTNVILVISISTCNVLVRCLFGLKALYSYMFIQN